MEDGEHIGSAKLRNTIGHQNLTNLSVFLVQVYERVHLGGERFTGIVLYG